MKNKPRQTTSNNVDIKININKLDVLGSPCAEHKEDRQEQKDKEVLFSPERMMRERKNMMFFDSPEAFKIKTNQTSETEHAK